MAMKMLNIRRITSTTKLFQDKLPITQLLCICERSTQTQPAVQDSEDSYKKQLKDFEKLSNITRKTRQKKPQRPPFAKNLFLGKFDTEILTYPELEKEEVENLEKDNVAVSKLLRQAHMVNSKSLSEKHFRQNLSDYKMIGLQASQLLEGRECNVTESLKFLETLCEHNLRENIVYNEQLGVQTLIKFSSENVQKKFLYPIIKGELLAAFCLNEPESFASNSLKTKAEISKDGKNWILNGEKCWVINGKSADVYIVIATSKVILRDSCQETKLTGFIVDRNSSGINVTKDMESNVESATVKFTDVIVPVENVIGTVNDGEVILKFLMDELRLATGVICINITKQNILNLMKDILQRSDDNNILYKTDAVRERIGEALVDLYAMESMVYLTSGLIDTYEKQDCELECGLVKIFSAEKALKISNYCLDSIGPSALDVSHWANVLHQQSIRYISMPQNNDTLRILASLIGFQHAGEEKQEFIEKIRNPLVHANFNVYRMWKNRKDINDNPKLDLGLGDYLHPSCLAPAECLEYSVKRLGFAAEMLLTRHGGNIINAHMDLRRISDVVLDIYAMTAVLGRASRSYCIGLQNAYFEVVLAASFCAYAKQRVKDVVQQIQNGPYVTNDDNYRSLAKRLFKFKDYYFKHPLSRNF